MEAAGIEPASSESEDGSRPEGNPDDSEAGRLASDDGHEVERLDDDPRSQRGRSAEMRPFPHRAETNDARLGVPNRRELSRERCRQ